MDQKMMYLIRNTPISWGMIISLMFLSDDCRLILYRNLLWFWQKRSNIPGIHWHSILIGWIMDLLLRVTIPILIPFPLHRNGPHTGCGMNYWIMATARSILFFTHPCNRGHPISLNPLTTESASSITVAGATPMAGIILNFTWMT